MDSKDGAIGVDPIEPLAEHRNRDRIELACFFPGLIAIGNMIEQRFVV